MPQIPKIGRYIGNCQLTADFTSGSLIVIWLIIGQSFSSPLKIVPAAFLHFAATSQSQPNGQSASKCSVRGSRQAALLRLLFHHSHRRRRRRLVPSSNDCNCFTGKWPTVRSFLLVAVATTRKLLPSFLPSSLPDTGLGLNAVEFGA